MALNLCGAYKHTQPNTQPCWPRLSCHPISTIHISGLVHTDTSDPTRNRADLVCYATQSLATHYHGVATNQSFKALIGNVLCVCLCQCINMYIIYSIITSTNSRQAYIIILTQHFNNYITFQNVTRQWPLAEVKYKLIAAGTTILLQWHPSSLQRWTPTTRAFQPEPTRCSENYTRCNKCSLSQPNRAWNSKLNLLFTSEPFRCGENSTHCSECSQCQGFTNPNLLVAARITLATASAQNSHQL